MMRELEMALNTMDAIVPMTAKMDETAFVPMFCVLAETWCNAHNKDVIEFISMVSELVVEINQTLGPYVC